MKEKYFNMNDTSMTPGMQVKVVNSYEAASLSVDVIKLRKVDYRKNHKLEHVLTIINTIWHSQCHCYLANGGESNQSHSSIARFHNIKAFTFGSS